MRTIEASRRPMRCPRCGYDLRGSRGDWSERCPLEGTCTECGLVFHWGHVIQPEKFEPRWCVEFAEPVWRVPRATVVTLLWSAMPRRFWSTLRMSDRIRPGRLGGYVGFLFVTLVALYFVQQALVAAAFRWQLEQRIGTISYSFAAAMWDAVSRPLAGTSSWNGGWYPPPIELHLHVHGFYLYSFGDTTGRILFGAGVFVLWPLAFVLLPVSRRRARVRWGHIARVFVYGLAIPWALLAAYLLGLGVGGWYEGVVQVGTFVVRVGAIPLLMLWWMVAIHRYLKMPHATSVTIILTVVVLLVQAAILSVVAPDYLTELTLDLVR